MTQRMSRIFLIVGFCVLTLSIGIALYLVFFQPILTPSVVPGSVAPGEQPVGTLPPSPQGAPVTTAPTPESELPTADTIAKGGVTKAPSLTTSAVASLNLSSDGKRLQFYDPNDGKFYRMDKTGAIERLSERKFPEAKNVVWNRGGEKAVIEFPDDSNILYDFDNETSVTLPKQWKDFAFSPNRGELIAKSIGLDPNNRFLIQSKDDGSNVRPLHNLGNNEHKVIVAWSPEDQVIGFADTDSSPGALDRKMIFPLGKGNENFKGLTVEGLNFIPEWAPDGKRLLYSVVGSYSNYKPLLWVVNATPNTMGTGRRSIPLNTWADKCTFANASTLYCAVPNFLPDNAGLQRSLFTSTSDAFYKVDLDTGSTSLVAIPETESSAKQLFVAPDESSLYYTENATGILKTIQLK